MDTDGNIRSFLSAPSSATGIDLSQNWQGILWLTLLFVIFVIAGGFFGAAESGFSAMNKIRIKAKAEDGNRRAKRALYVDEHFDKALTTLLISGNIAHIAAAALATVIATRLFGESETVTVLTTVITTVIVFLFSEMIPKSFANDRSETTALSLGWLVIFLMRFFYPLVWFFTLISKGFSKFISLFVKVDKEHSITEEELYDIIDTRYRSKKPMILTTNMTMADMLNEDDIRYTRIYDRIFEMCVPIPFEGYSWRKAEAARRADRMKAFMEKEL